jgi:hypothetical protein
LIKEEGTVLERGVGDVGVFFIGVNGVVKRAIWAGEVPTVGLVLQMV